ncbi:MAG TPA: hypothetical protein VF314_17100 [Actinomycetes bacterium]
MTSGGGWRPPPAGPAPSDELSSGDGEREGPRRLANPWVVRGIGLLALAVVVVLVGPGLVSSSERPRPPDRNPRPTTSQRVTSTPTPTPRPAAALAWKARGDLADDRAFTSAVLERVGRDRVGASKVLLAATLPEGSRAAVVAVQPQELGIDVGPGVEVMGVYVAPGSSVDRATVALTGGISGADELGGWAGHGTDGHVYALVVGRPAPFSLRVSGRLDWHPDGTATRRWRGVDSRDGAVVVDLGTRVDPLVVARPEALGPTFPLQLQVDGCCDLTQPTEPIQVEGVDAGSYRGPAPEDLSQAVFDVTRGVLDTDAVSAHVVWSGRLSNAERATLVVVRRRDGPTFQTLLAENGDPSTSEGVSTWAQGLRPVPWADADRMPWLADPGGGPTGRVSLISPSGRGTAVVAEAGRDPVTVRLDATGVALLPAGLGNPYGGSPIVVTVRSPSGRVVVQTALSPQQLEDPFLTGP